MTWNRKFCSCKSNVLTQTARVYLAPIPAQKKRLNPNSNTSKMSLQALFDQGDGLRDISTGLQTLRTEVSHTSASIARLTSIQKGPEPDLLGLGITLLIERLDQHLSTIFKWLSPLFEDFQTKQRNTFNITARQDANCLSLIMSEEFQKWTQVIGQLLWCLGPSKSLS